MIYFAESFWNSFSSLYYNCYSLLTILLLLAFFFQKQQWKDENNNWLYTLNTAIAWISFTNFLFLLIEVFLSWYGQNPYEWYAFGTSDYLYGYLFWILFATSIIPLIFIIRKVRTNRVVTFITLLLINSGFITNLVYKLYRDYLPSSWSTYYDEPFVQKIAKWLLLPSAILFTYWLAHKRKRLPFKSPILSYSLFFISYSLFHCIQNFN